MSLKYFKETSEKYVFEVTKTKKKDELKKWYLMLITPFQR